MMPISEIHVGDQFENPMLFPNGCTFVVVDINLDEKMVKVQAIDRNANVINQPFYKKNRDRMFSESWRVFNMANRNA